MDRCRVQLGVSFEPTEAPIAWLLATKRIENGPKWAGSDRAAPKVRLMESPGLSWGTALAVLPNDFAVGCDGDQINRSYRFIFFGAQIDAKPAHINIGHRLERLL